MRKQGFTLIEVLIATAIAGITGALLIQVLAQNNGVYYQQTAKVSAGTSVNNALTAISNDVKSAATVMTGYPPSSPTVTSTTNSLVLGFASLDNNSNVIIDTYDYVVIMADSSHPNILREIIYPDPSSIRKASNKVLLDNLSSITFSYLNNAGSVVAPTLASKIAFTINVSVSTGGQPQQKSVSSTVSLRNQ